MSVPARVTWKDTSGAVRFASVTTRDVGDAGVFVECETGAAMLELETDAGPPGGTTATNSWQPRLTFCPAMRACQSSTSRRTAATP